MSAIKQPHDMAEGGQAQRELPGPTATQQGEGSIFQADTFGMFMPITRLRHKARLVTLRQLSQTTTQAASGLGRQAPAGRFVTGRQGGFMLIPVVIP
jgi:hypothetical protein